MNESEKLPQETDLSSVAFAALMMGILPMFITALFPLSILGLVISLIVQKKDDGNLVTAAVICNVICIVSFWIIMRPADTEVQPVREIEMEAYELSYTYPQQFYGNMFSENANLVQGGAVFAKDDCIYVPNDGKVLKMDLDAGKQYDTSIKAEKGVIVYNDESLEIKRDKIIFTTDEKRYIINYNWRDVYSNGDGTVNYSSLYCLLAKESQEGATLEEMASLVGFTEENILLGYDEQGVYFTESENDGVHIYKQYGEREEDILELGIIETEKKILYMRGKLYYVDKKGDSVYFVNTQGGNWQPDRVLHMPESSVIDFMNISDSENGSYLCITTGKRIFVYGLETGNKSTGVMQEEIEGIYCSGIHFYVNYKKSLNFDYFTFKG